jgi:hypothetical protein
MITHVNKIGREERLHVGKAGPLSVFCGVSIKHFIKRKKERLMQVKTLLFYPNLLPTHKRIHIY